MDYSSELLFKNSILIVIRIIIHIYKQKNIGCKDCCFVQIVVVVDVRNATDMSNGNIITSYEFRDTYMMGVRRGLSLAPSQSLNGGEVPLKD